MGEKKANRVHLLINIDREKSCDAHSNPQRSTRTPLPKLHRLTSIQLEGIDLWWYLYIFYFVNLPNGMVERLKKNMYNSDWFSSLISFYGNPSTGIAAPVTTVLSLETKGRWSSESHTVYLSIDDTAPAVFYSFCINFLRLLYICLCFCQSFFWVKSGVGGGLLSSGLKSIGETATLLLRFNSTIETMKGRKSF